MASAASSTGAAHDGRQPHSTQAIFFHEYGKIPSALARGHYTSALLKLCVLKGGGRQPVVIGPALRLQIIQSERHGLCLQRNCVGLVLVGSEGLSVTTMLFTRRWIPHPGRHQPINTVSSPSEQTLVRLVT
jgi:hypothetical protein